MMTGVVIIFPLVVITFVVAVIIGVFQAMTQINEQTLSFAPKLIVVVLIMLLFGGLMFDKLVQLIQDTLKLAPTIF
jgi:flagellar biosynthetic protein FliQ